MTEDDLKQQEFFEGSNNPENQVFVEVDENKNEIKDTLDIGNLQDFFSSGAIKDDPTELKESNHRYIFSKLFGENLYGINHKDTHLFTNIDIIEKYLLIDIDFKFLKKMDKTYIHLLNCRDLKKFEIILEKYSGNIKKISDILNLIEFSLRFGEDLDDYDVTDIYYRFGEDADLYIENYIKIKDFIPNHILKDSFISEDTLSKIIYLNDIDIFIRLIKNVSLPNVSTERFAGILNGLYHFYNNFGEKGVNNLIYLNTVLSNEDKITSITIYSGLLDDKVIFKIDGSVLKNIVDLIGKDNLKLDFLNDISIGLVENSLQILEKTKLEIKGKVLSILDSVDINNKENDYFLDEGKSQEDNFKIFELLHNKIGKEIVEDKNLLESIYKSNLSDIGIKSLILNKYDLEGKELIKLLYFLFPYQKDNIVEKFQELENGCPNIFGFEKLNENYTFSNTYVYPSNMNNLLSIIKNVKNSRIKNIFKKFNIKTDDNFKKLQEGGNINILTKGLDKNFDYIMNLSANLDEYLYISGMSDVYLFSILELNDKDFSFLKQFNINLQKEILTNVNNVEKKILFTLEENILLQNIDEKYIKDALLNPDIFGRFITVYQENKKEIDNHKNGGDFGLFSYLVKNELYDNLEVYHFTKDYFLDYMDNNDVFIDFDEGNNIKWKGTKPWTKKWFLEKPERKEYLNRDYIKTFNKFGNIIALGIMEGIKDPDSLEEYYENIFGTISPEKNRGSILQLGEVFNLILKQESYEMFDKLVEGQNIGTEFKNFIEENSISDKGRTIVTLMITKEIRDSFAIFKNTDGEQEVDYLSVGEMLTKVQNKLRLYKTEIDKYKNVPIKTSIGMEYEVTESIAKAYTDITSRDYKKDILILSEYSGIAQGNDAVHEIATKPTDNPMLLILEMKLLQDLDFIDLNFKKQDYNKGSRGLHITVGGEKGIELDHNTNFIQNILIASNIGGLNAGKEINIVNWLSNIREKGYDCDIVFGENRTECVEYRSLSLDKAEQFERMILSIFNLNMAYQDLNFISGKLGKKFEKLKNDISNIIYQI